MIIKKIFKRVVSVILTASMIGMAAITNTGQLSSTEAAEANGNSTSSTSMKATNSLGELLIAASEENKSEDTAVSSDFGISEVIIGKDKAEVSYYAAANCNIVIGFYNDEDTKLITSCQQEVPAAAAQNSNVSIPLPSDVPEYFMLKAFILDKNQVPLGNNYTSTLYTEGVSEIVNSDASDYNANYVVNLDESNDTNFIVLKKSTIQIPYDGKNNLLQSYDEKTGVYVFSNVNSKITGLRSGDIVFCDSSSNENLALFTVASVKVSGTTATVTTSEMELVDAVDVVKIDAVTCGEIDAEKGEDLGNGVTFEGEVASVDEEEENTSKPYYLPSSDGVVLSKDYDILSKGTYTPKAWEISFNSSKQLGSDDDHIACSGSVTGRFELPIEYEFYFNNETESFYVELGISGKFSLSGKLGVEGVVTISLNKVYAKILKMLKIDLVSVNIGPALRIEGNTNISLNVVVEFKITLKSTAPYFIINKPTVNGEVKAEGEAFIGLVLQLGSSAGGKKGLKIENEAKIGFKVEGEIERGDGKTHECSTCLNGELSFVISGKSSFKCEIEFLKHKFDKEKTYEKEFKLHMIDFYYSFAHHEWGKGECPYKITPVTIKAVDQHGNQLDGANIVIKKNDAVASVSNSSSSYTTALYIPNDKNQSYTYEVNYAGNYMPAEKSGTITANGESKEITVTLNVEEWSDEYPRGGNMIYPEGYDDPKSPNFQPVGGLYIFPGIGNFWLYDDGHAKIQGLDPATGGVIPREINGYLVTEGSLGLAGFTDISIPDTLLGGIDDSMILQILRNYTGTITISAPAEFIFMPNSLHGSDMSGLNLPDTLTGIVSYAFKNCINLENVTIPNSVTYIGDYAFTQCTSLEKVVLPKSLKRIESGTFNECTSLKSVTIPDSVTYIGDCAFSGCTSLESITIPDSVTYIGNNAFCGCTSLESITIPDSVTYIDNRAFCDCTNLESINIPDSVTYIGGQVFENSGLTSINIPKSIKTNLDFSNIPNLKSITFPKQTINHVNGYFYNLPELTDVYCLETEEEWNEECAGRDPFYKYKDQIQMHFLESTKKPSRKESSVYFNSAEIEEENSSSEIEPTQPDYTVNDTEKLPTERVEKIVNFTKITFEKALPDSKYVLLAVRDDKAVSLTDRSNLLYVDQQTADENGKAVFTFDELPKNTVFIITGETRDGEFFRYSGTPSITDKTINGDVNLDGEISSSDIVMLQKWLIGAGKLTYWQHADLCKDNKINVFDLCAMKRKLINCL